MDEHSYINLKIIQNEMKMTNGESRDKMKGGVEAWLKFILNRYGVKLLTHAKVFLVMML